jgi:hypothetical protein
MGSPGGGGSVIEDQDSWLGEELLVFALLRRAAQSAPGFKLWLKPRSEKARERAL